MQQKELIHSKDNQSVRKGTFEGDRLMQERAQHGEGQKKANITLKV